MFLRNGANYGGAISFRAQSKTMNQPQGARAVVSNISVFENHAKSGGWHGSGRFYLPVFAMRGPIQQIPDPLLAVS